MRLSSLFLTMDTVWSAVPHSWSCHCSGSNLYYHPSMLNCTLKPWLRTSLQLTLVKQFLMVITKATNAYSFLRCTALCISNLHNAAVQTEDLTGTKKKYYPGFVTITPGICTHVYYSQQVLLYVLQDHTLLKSLTSNSSWWFSNSKRTIKLSSISIYCYQPEEEIPGCQNHSWAEVCPACIVFWEHSIIVIIETLSR